MKDFDQQIQEGEIKLAMKLATTMKWARNFLAAIIAFAYLGGYSWAMDAVIVAVILLLVVPLGFFDVFIQKLVEYNTETLEKSGTRTNWTISYSDPVNKLTFALAGSGYGGNSISKERCHDPIPSIPDIPG